MGNLVWITGAGGLIGSHLVKTAPPKWKVRPLMRKDIDLLEPVRMTSLLDHEEPDVVIHCAAISKNPVCDADPFLARHVNSQATVNLTVAASKIPFVFLSTDLVFDGQKGNYVEADQVNPLSVYAGTKADVEQIVLQD